jgi:hypothetical protein
LWRLNNMLILLNIKGTTQINSCGSVLLSFGATVFFIPNAYAINNTEAIGGLALEIRYVALENYKPRITSQCGNGT